MPQVVCIVVHHGATRWLGGSDLLDNTGVVSGMWPDPSRFLLNLPFILDDLYAESVGALRDREMPALPRLALFCLKRARDAVDFVAELRPWIAELGAVSQVASPTVAHVGLFSYIMEVADVTYSRILEFIRLEVGPAAEKLLKSTYDQILEKGQAKGKAEGKAEGVAEMAEVLLRLLARRFGEVPQEFVDRVRSSPIQRIGLWVERVLDAESLEQVLAEE